MSTSDSSPAGRGFGAAMREALASAAGRPSAAVRHPPHLRLARSVNWRFVQFLIASAPAVAFGAWRLGAGAASSAGAADGGANSAGWRRSLVAALQPDLADAAWFEFFLLGLALLLPLLAVAFVVCLFWEVLFAVLLERPADAGWLMTAWLYVALMPPWTPLLVAAFGISFGAVFGSHVFGGTGRYLVSPALLGAIFVGIAFPSLSDQAAWIEFYGDQATWDRLAAAGSATLVDSGMTWLRAFAGLQISVPGATSALLCLLGAAYLMLRDVASWRTLAGATAGLIIAATIGAQAGETSAGIAWYWHLSTGSLAFGLAFLATDPTTMPLTRSARWIHGFLAGLLVVVMRVANPQHPEATLSALLLAGLCVPLLDHVSVGAFVRAQRWRARR